MRGLLALALAFAVLAAPALAQKAPAKAVEATAALLRGPVDAPAGEAAPAPSDAPALPALLAPLAEAPPKPDPARCRMSCASSYYFCIASEASDDCPGTWGQCRAACSAS